MTFTLDANAIAWVGVVASLGCMFILLMRIAHYNRLVKTVEQYWEAAEPAPTKTYGMCGGCGVSCEIDEWGQPKYHRCYVPDESGEKVLAQELKNTEISSCWIR